MADTILKDRVSGLERMMMELAYESMKTDIALRDLASQMTSFKDEMADFKNEMSDFKDEMSDFKNEIRNDTKTLKKDLNKKWGELANKMGTIVEDIVAPGLRGVARQYFGVEEFDLFTPRIRLRNNDRSQIREFDVIAETEDYFFIVETKASPRTEYISAFIKFLPELSTWFPASLEKKLVPIFASLYLSDENIRYLTRNNILAMATSDGGMDIYNKELLSKFSVK
ncbi:MAG: hypothetical protein RBR67_19140 [Desulfobacterium sp.]|nr:hypothetical protein [Desulfobacterium sp.]